MLFVICNLALLLCTAFSQFLSWPMDMFYPKSNKTEFERRCLEHRLHPHNTTLPLPSDKFEDSYLQAILKEKADEEKVRIDNEKVRIDNEKVRIDNEKVLIDNEKMRIDNEKVVIDKKKVTLSYVGLVVICISLINFGAGTDKALQNIKEILQKFVNIFESFVKALTEFSLKNILCGKKDKKDK